MLFEVLQAQILDSSAKEINVSLRDIDIGTLYVIQHELLKSPSIDFAGVIVKHPLTSEYWLRVSSSKGSPMGEIERAIATALKTTEQIKTAFDSKIGSK